METPTAIIVGQYKTWTLDSGLNCGLDLTMDSIFGLEFQLPGVRGHAKVISNKFCCELIICALQIHYY